MEQGPDISQITVQRTLVDLQKSREILKFSGGRYTVYVWNREKEREAKIAGGLKSKIDHL